MKKLMMVAIVAIISVVAVQARSNYRQDASVLPAAAQSVISSNFKASVSLVKVDKDFGRVSEYEVILTDGTEITFDSKGNVKEIETARNGSVPAAFIPQPVSMYVNKYHSTYKIIGFEKQRKGYEVTLSNGLELKFDKIGNFVKYDK